MSHSAARYAVIDAVRGFAIWLMFVYHFSWNLTYFGFADFGVVSDPYWIWFARFIAGTILLVMGISQAIAAKREFNLRSFVKRLTLIAASAVAISIGTYQMDPNTFIFFGILHHIALASIIMLLIVRLPTQTLVVLALFCLIAPRFFVHDIFFVNWLWWVGLSPVTPPTIDYVPLLPWLGVSIIGVLVGRHLFTDHTSSALVEWRPTTAPTRLLHLAGRHSLLLYMIHQPVLFGGVYGLYWILNS